MLYRGKIGTQHAERKRNILKKNPTSIQTFPAISGAEPCTASARAIPPSPILQLRKIVFRKTEQKLKWDIRIQRQKSTYLGVRPKPPIRPAQRSLIMSP